MTWLRWFSRDQRQAPVFRAWFLGLGIALAVGLGPLWAFDATAFKEAEAYLYSLPYEPGRKELVTMGFNDWPTHTGHYMVDWLLDEGTPLLAARDGKVIEVVESFSKSGLTPEFYQKSNYVLIQHSDGSIAQYNHLQKKGAKVKVGQQVKEGQLIALSGNTGYSSAPHLHFQVYFQKGNTIKTVPVRFKSGMAKPYEIFRDCRYLAPGPNCRPDYDPVEEAFPGELAKIKFRLREIVRGEKDDMAAARAFTNHLKQNIARYTTMYHDIYWRSQKGDMEALTLLDAFSKTLDIQTDSNIARLLENPATAELMQENIDMWQQMQVIDTENPPH
jgi:hypothetical protein